MLFLLFGLVVLIGLLSCLALRAPRCANGHTKEKMRRLEPAEIISGKMDPLEPGEERFICPCCEQTASRFWGALSFKIPGL